VCRTERSEIRIALLPDRLGFALATSGLFAHNKLILLGRRNLTSQLIRGVLRRHRAQAARLYNTRPKQPVGHRLYRTGKNVALGWGACRTCGFTMTEEGKLDRSAKKT
jgi:hypothetical protein